MFKKQNTEPVIRWRKARQTYKVERRKLRRQAKKLRLLRKQAKLTYKLTK